MEGDWILIALVIAVLAISVSVHEAAHAWVAWKCGDPTGRLMGRITLNPIPHIDPFMTLVLPLVLLLTTGFVFGGAKPVPVDFHQLRRPWRDMSFVAAAGPASNVLLAILFDAGRIAALEGGYDAQMILPQVLEYGVLLNLVLAVFNLIPIPPLDGSRIFAWLLPASTRESYLRMEAFGMILVFVLLLSGALTPVIGPTLESFYGVVHSIATLGRA